MSGSGANHEELSDAARDAHRLKSAQTMESFISGQLQTILHPVLRHIEEIDSKVGKLEKGLEKATADIGRNAVAIESSSDSSGRLLARVKEVESKALALHEAMGENNGNTEKNRQDLAAAKADIAQTYNRLEDAEHGALPKLQHDVQKLEQKSVQARRHLEAVAAIVDDHPIKKDINELSVAVKALAGEQSGAHLGRERLRHDVDELLRSLQETSQIAERNRVHGAALQKGLQDVSSREGQLQQQINGWKDQWSKLHPEIQACANDIVQVRTRTDHHDASIHSVQQGCLHNAKCVDALQHNQDKIRVDLQAVCKDLTTTHGEVVTVREGLADAAKVSNNLSTGLEETSCRLRRTTTWVESLDNRNVVMVEDLEKTRHAVVDLQADLKKSATLVQTVQRDLERTKTTLTSTRTDLASTSSNVESLKGDLGSTKNTLHRLDHGVEFCSGNFAGLQKGFMATGTHIQQRKSVALATPRPQSKGNC